MSGRRLFSSFMPLGLLPVIAILLPLMLMPLLEPVYGNKYTTKYDNVDIDAVLRNERLLAGYVGCLLDIKPCTPDAAELKRNLPDGLSNNCSACSETQRMISEKLTHHLIDHKPEEWKLLEEKYDPTGSYRERYLESGKLPGHEDGDEE